MCVQCVNDDFEINIVESVNVDGKNYSVITNDIKDSLSMILAGLTFGDNYAATVVIETGDLVIDDQDKYYDALKSGALDPEVNKSLTIPYFGEASREDVETGHRSMVSALKVGITPKWQTIDAQRESVLYSTDSMLDFLIGSPDDIN